MIYDKSDEYCVDIGRYWPAFTLLNNPCKSEALNGGYKATIS